MLKYKDLVENFQYPDAKVVEFAGEQVFVKQYLPAIEKYELIKGCLIILNLAAETYNPLLSEILFDYEVAATYSNIDLKDENITSIFKIYDVLHNSGLIDLIIAAIPEDEYEELTRLYNESILYEKERYGNVAMTINDVVSFLPRLFEQAIENLQPDDIDKLDETIDKITQLKEEQHI